MTMVNFAADPSSEKRIIGSSGVSSVDYASVVQCSLKSPRGEEKVHSPSVATPAPCLELYVFDGHRLL